MRRSVLSEAQKLLKRRRFAAVIKLLEGNSELYEDNFEYYLMLGTACLYLEDVGSAASYFSRARKIKLSDTRLLLGQAAIYLRRGDTDRAVQYYFDIQDYDPNNKIAAKAMEFIRVHGDYDTICRWVESGRITQFYPALGVNPVVVRRVLLGLLVCAGGVLLYMNPPRIQFPFRYGLQSGSERADLSAVVLTNDESQHAQEADLSGGVYRYILSNKQINDSYKNALKFFNEHRDNAARVELNRILNANAAEGVRAKAQAVVALLLEPTFDTLKDNYSCTEVNADPLLYQNCWVAWTGRITNMPAQDAGVKAAGEFKCDLIVGDAALQRIEGVVPLSFDTTPSPAIDGDKPVQVLAQIIVENGRIKLHGKSVYQSISGLMNVPK